MEESYEDMAARIWKDGNEIISSLTKEKMELLHAAVGVTGELEELVQGIDNSDRENVIEELGDLTYYLTVMKQNPLITADVTIGGDPSEGLPKGNDHTLLDIVKKVVIYNNSKEETLKKLNDEFLACVNSLNYLTRALEKEFSFTFEEAKQANQNKLAGKGGRYEKGYSDAAAAARADKNREG